MSTFLQIMQAVAINAGIEPVISISTSDSDHVLLAQCINDAGSEVARRVDWSVLRKAVTFSGVGTPSLFDLPPDYRRLQSGLAVTQDAQPVRGSLTADEWASLPPTMGAPRYYYLASGRIAFYPYLRAGDAVQVRYQSDAWVDSGARQLVQAGDTPLIPPELLVSGGTWRWRRHVGKDFADAMAEFETQLADLAAYDGGVRQP